jgi:hypothetical protein
MIRAAPIGGFESSEMTPEEINWLWLERHWKLITFHASRITLNAS